MDFTLFAKKTQETSARFSQTGNDTITGDFESFFRSRFANKVGLRLKTPINAAAVSSPRPVIL